MERRAVFPKYPGPPRNKASIAWLVIVICTIGAALLTVMMAAQGVSAQEDEPGAGWFQKCSLAKMGYFDPIVFPGQQEPVGHRHLFVGSTAISPTSTSSDLQTGSSTCLFQENSNAAKVFVADGANGGNYSSYWAPDLMLRNGQWASVKQVNAYYKKGPSSVDAQKVEPYPQGLKMVIRDRNNSQTNVKWYCSSQTTGSNGIYRERPYDCKPNSSQPWVTTHITFPQCGTGATDGVSPDYNSHMAYADANGCPTTHPHVYPRLILRVKYATSLGASSKLATQVGEPSDHADPGTSFHADYFEGWKPGTLQYFVDHCIHAGINCQAGGGLP